jgi:predicted DNA-binding transcriptional regulator AlpA
MVTLLVARGKAAMTKKIGIQRKVGVLDDLVDRDGAARLLGVVPRTLDRWNADRVGPRRIRLGRKIRYRLRSLEEWVRSREEGSR